MNQRSVALITGGASGFGRAIAKRLASAYTRVVITDVQVELGKEVAATEGFIFLEHDVRDEARWNRIIKEIEAKFGPLSALINNAGIAGPMDAADPESTRIEDWRRVFSVNVEGVFLGCKAAIPAMRRTGEGGVIINICSVAGLQASPDALAYGASKAAVRQLTKSVAQYCAEKRLNIRCNSVHPGNALTPLWTRFAEEAARARNIPIEEIIEQGRAAAPMGDFVGLEEVAGAVSYLASEDARSITGEQLIIDGGYVNCDTYHRRLVARSQSSAG